jgi:uncharacterized protein YegP (UPF0339 family)
VAAKFVLEKGTGGSFRFRLMSRGRVLATSETYSTKRAAQNAIASVQSGVSGATVEDATETRPSRAASRKAAPVAKAARKARKVAKRMDSVVKTAKRAAPSSARSLVAPAGQTAMKTARKTAGTKSAARPIKATRARKVVKK